MEIRELRYFVAVAEELHFNRAAERLGMAQPPLSRAIRQLERHLDAPLFERNSRGVSLTEAGEVLLAEARVILESVEAAERRTRRAAPTASGRAPLILVVKAGASAELVAKLLDAYAAEPGSLPVDVVLCGPGEQEATLREGRADVGLLHPPIDDVTGFDYEELLTEGRVALLPAGHPLSVRPRLTMAEIDDVPGLPRPRWSRPDGTYPDGPGPAVRDHAQLLQLVGLGRAMHVGPDSCRSSLGSDVVAVPVVDAPPITTVIAWPPHSRNRAVADLVRTATRL